MEETVAARRLRPFARRRFKMARPDLVFIRSRKPCLRRRLIRLGWNVRFIGADPHFFWRRRSDFRIAATRVAVRFESKTTPPPADAGEKERKASNTRGIVGSGPGTAESGESGLESTGDPRPDFIGRTPDTDRNGGRPGKRGILPTRRRPCQCSKQGFCQRNSHLPGSTEVLGDRRGIATTGRLEGRPRVTLRTEAES